jgi:hypothetical protein
MTTCECIKSKQVKWKFRHWIATNLHNRRFLLHGFPNYSHVTAIQACIATVNQQPPAHHEGWMVTGQETVFCWISVPKLTTVVSSVGRLLVGRGQSELTATNAPVGRSVHWMGCVFSFGAGLGLSQSISFCCWPLYFFFSFFFLVLGRFSWTWPHT